MSYLDVKLVKINHSTDRSLEKFEGFIVDLLHPFTVQSIYYRFDTLHNLHMHTYSISKYTNIHIPPTGIIISWCSIMGSIFYWLCSMARVHYDTTVFITARRHNAPVPLHFSFYNHQKPYKTT